MSAGKKKKKVYWGYNASHDEEIANETKEEENQSHSHDMECVYYGTSLNNGSQNQCEM